MTNRETLAREMFMWSECCGIEDWHKLPIEEMNYWRNLASLAMQVLRVCA